MSDTALTTSNFDYGSLDAEARIVVQQRTGEIKGLMRRTASDIVEVGQKLIEVKDRLPHGEFGSWLAAEFEWTERTARRFMSVATAFKADTVSDLNADARTLYLLAAASTPDGPVDLSCADLALADVQSLMVNQAVAGWAATYLAQLLLSHDLDVYATYFDLVAGSARSLPITG